MPRSAELTFLTKTENANLYPNFTKIIRYDRRSPASDIVHYRDQAVPF